MFTLRRGTALLAGLLLLAACSGGSGEVPATVCVGDATTYLDWLNGDLQPDVQDPIEQPASTAGDLLETIQQSGILRVATDSDYAPQSFKNPDGTWQGFDIDVATEVAHRLGVEPEFQHQDWAIITAGNWNSRWDVSVGSMTITTDRKPIFAFTQPYYYTPAYLAASEDSGVTSLDDLPFTIPDDIEPITRPTDANCIEDIAAGRPEFDLLITSGTVIDGAIANDQPIVKIGEPIYQENLAIALDQNGPEMAGLLYEIDKAIGDMHADGTLTSLSEQWFDGADLTQDPSAGQ